MIELNTGKTYIGSDNDADGINRVMSMLMQYDNEMAKLIRQRDLAVKALNNIATTTYSDDPCGKYVRDAREALSAIKGI